MLRNLKRTCENIERQMFPLLGGIVGFVAGGSFADGD